MASGAVQAASHAAPGQRRCVQHTQLQAFTQRHAVATWPSPVNAIISWGGPAGSRGARRGGRYQ